MQSYARPLALFTILGMFALMVGSGCGREAATGTANPYYRQGLNLRQNDQMEEAAEAFRKCLRASPGTTQAHFQLATLYQDHLSQPVKALYHYTAFLERQSDNPTDAAVARQSIERIQRTLFEQWMEKYRDELPEQAIIREQDRQIRSLRQARQALIDQTRDLIAEIRLKDQQIKQLQEN